MDVAWSERKQKKILFIGLCMNIERKWHNLCALEGGVREAYAEHL